MPSRLSLPFKLSRSLSEAQQSAVEQEALAANDRYVVDFLEAHGLCPYARSGRERGVTERTVHFAQTDSAEQVCAIFERAAPRDVEVLQIIFPLIEIEAAEFARFCSEVTEACNQRLPRPVFASAALHPELAYRTDSATGLISLFRRAPDPTLQWVRLATLDNIYRGRKGGTSFVDLAQLQKMLKALPKRDLYDEIARANQSTAEELGIEQVERHLGRLSSDAAEAYRRILDQPTR